MKSATVLLLFLTTFAVLFAQDKYILKADGSLKQKREILPANSSHYYQKNIQKITPYDGQLEGISNLLDTLRYAPESYNWTVNFGFFGQDVMVQWFEAPTDMFVHAISFRTSDDTGNLLSVKIVKMNWTIDQIQELGEEQLGYYEGSEIYPFPDDPENNGTWTAIAHSEWGEPFGRDLWSNNGSGVDVTIESGYRYWISMSELDSVPVLKEGDVFAVAIKNESPHKGADRAGLFADQLLNKPGLKFYANGRFALNASTPDSSSWGWWSRSYTFDIEVAVELYGDRGPTITLDYATILGNTTILDPRRLIAKITDDNPSGGPAGVDSAFIMYSIDEKKSWQAIPMTPLGDDLWEGYIPEEYGDILPNTTVYYYVRAVDVQGNEGRSKEFWFRILGLSGNWLFIYDASYQPYNYGIMFTDFYAYGLDSLIHLAPFSGWDLWDGIQFGSVPKEVINNYRLIYWVTGFYPTNVPPAKAFKEWLEEGTPENQKYLFITGQDFVGRYTGFADSMFAEGTFESMIGIKSAGADIVDGNSDKYFLDPVKGNKVTNYIFNSTSDSSRLAYDPQQLDNINYLDNLVPDEHADVFMTDPNNGNSAVGVYKEGVGYKAAYLMPDPYCLVMVNPEDSSQVANVTKDMGNIFYYVLARMGLVTSLPGRESTEFPVKFSLAQNYPNPFNPITTIEYTVGTIRESSAGVMLTIYDVLGRKVKTLLNKKQPAGSYTVTFEPNNLSSGVYYYQLSAGDFIQTRKMLLLR